jgi:hypothetical protein
VFPPIFFKVFLKYTDITCRQTKDAYGFFQSKGGMKMVISPITQTNSTAVASNAGAMPANKETIQSKPQPSATDTVQISSAAQKALQEATETPAQTAKEARSGDLQAKRLLAKETANAEEAKESPAVRAQEVQATQQAQATSVSNLE